ncbi:hypothetical protein GCM10022237_08280 [Nocardioides ginsengisoli]|uniref:Uncharacterized protein n=1 Tax=Nocardioides ginsengisoli TaxID=363868 RepID=A0ABW3VZV8_9ACTN
MSAMTDVRIGRFHARYHQVTPEHSLALDRALADLAGGALDPALDPALDQALAAAAGPELARVWAVCIPEVRVDVTLGDGSVAAWTAAWANAVAGAVRAALAGVSATAPRHRAGGDAPARPASGPVTRPVSDPAGRPVSRAAAPSVAEEPVDAAPAAERPDTHADAADRSDGSEPEVVVFPTRGEALVDLVRRTALADRRHLWAWRQCGLGTDVLTALLAEPLLVPGVLRAVGPDLLGRVLTPAELAALAARIASAAGLGGSTGVAATVVSPAAARAAAVLPGGARDCSAAAHRDLAVLAALTAAPGRAADPSFVAAVATALAASPADPALAPVTTEPEPDLEVEPDPDGEPTAWGGVWFLAHALPVLDLVPTDDAPALALAIAAFTGAPYDDPSVRLLCALTDDDPRDPDPVQEPDPATLAVLTGWLAERFAHRTDVPAPDDLWRRTARIHRHPGELEVGYALRDVDPVVRAAGLDLDPGWCPWLGESVRFRYA